MAPKLFKHILKQVFITSDSFSLGNLFEPMAAEFLIYPFSGLGLEPKRRPFDSRPPNQFFSTATRDLRD